MLRRAEFTISKRTVDGLSVEGKDAVFRASGSGSIRPGARSMSCRAVAREDRSALPSASPRHQHCTMGSATPPSPGHPSAAPLTAGLGLFAARGAPADDD